MLTQETIDLLKNYANYESDDDESESDITGENDEDVDVFDLCGGNFEDAYSLGMCY